MRAGSTQGTAFQLTDAQFSVIAVATPGKPGVVIDRIAYSAYGEATRTLRSDVNGDGFVDKDDYNGVIRPRNGAAIGTAAYLVEADLDRNGVISQSDYDIAVADDGKSSSGGVGEAGLFSRGVRNSVGYCGYIFNDESGLYTVRFRSYSPTLGRWLERDPAGYVDGMGLYEYVRGGPITAVDPMGLSTATGDRWWLDDEREALRHDLKTWGVWWAIGNYLQGLSTPNVQTPLVPLSAGTMRELLETHARIHLRSVVALIESVAIEEFEGQVRAACSGKTGTHRISLQPLEVDGGSGTASIDDPAGFFAAPLWRQLSGKPDAWASVLNRWTYRAAARCTFSGVVSCCRDGRVRIRGLLACRMRYTLVDDFDNPFDIGDPDADGYNFLGRKYDFFGGLDYEWTHRLDSASGGCACDAKEADVQ